MEENRSIIIVDDEKETLNGYADFLNSSGKSVTRRSSRRSASDLEASKTSQSPKKSEEKFNLLLASSGEEALQIFKNELSSGRRVAAGFFDVKLGEGMDGLSTIQAVKALDKDIHCVVVTAYHDRSVEEINELFGEEFKDQWDYLNKPFTQGEIIQKARQMLAAWNRRRQIEWMTQQLIRSERLAAVGQVARGVGHELGNILMRVLGKADLSLQEKDIAKIHENMNVIVKAVDRASVIIKNLQSFSKAEPQLKLAKVTSALDESLSLISHELVKFSVKLEKKIEDIPATKIDVGAMAQVFLNLMINALHAMPKGGTLTIRIGSGTHSNQAAGIKIAIEDTGTGIPPDVLPKIFEFAFSTKGDAGSGIGLSVSKEIVESHGGQISVSSELQKGTRFEIWLPVQGNA